MTSRWGAACLLGTAALLGSRASAQEPRVVSGRVLSVADSTPLVGVRIGIVGAAAQGESDAAGRFALRGVPAGAVRLIFERIGVLPDTVALAAGRRDLVVYLLPTAVPVRPLVAEAASMARQRFEDLVQTSTVSLDPAEIVSVPTVAEPDVTRVVQLLPGTVAKSDFTTGLNVRGGETDQNLIRLDGTTVFNPFHLGGMFSTFDAAAVNRVDFITGGFPAGFGGRLSSVLDVELRTGNRRETNVHGAVSLLSGKLLVEGPIFGTGASYLIGVRRTYADAFVDSFSDDPFTYYFGDAVGKASVPLGTGGTISATAYWGRDLFRLPWVQEEEGRDGIDLKFSWGNRLAGVTLRQPLGALEWEQHLSISEFSTGFGLVPDIEQIDNEVRLLSASTSFTLSHDRRHSVRLGVGVEDYDIRYDSRSEALGTQSLDLTYRPTTWAAFLDDQWRPVGWLLIRPGVRVERVFGGADFTAVAPRIGLKAFVSDAWALTGSAGRYYQALHSIRNHEVPVTLFEFWIGADDLTPVARSDHLVLGFERWFGSDVSLMVEGYTKSFDDLVVQNFRDDPKARGDEFIPASGYGRGVDLLLRKYAGRVTGWIAYGFNKTVRTTEDDPSFPPGHDRRHTLNVMVRAPGPLGSTMGVRWGYGSPLPYTGIVGQWLHREYNADRHAFDRFDDEAISTAINDRRFPHYSRLDVGFRWEFEKWGATWRPFFQLANVYNRRNIWVYTFHFDESPPVRRGLSQLPILPTFGMEFEW